MKFISNMSKVEGKLVNNKIKRYLREAEDFYLSFALLEPSTKDLYLKLRESYESLKPLRIEWMKVYTKLFRYAECAE